jgi:hypothetical protein
MVEASAVGEERGRTCSPKAGFWKAGRSAFSNLRNESEVQTLLRALACRR